MNSKHKGKRGELEVAAILREHGYNARRGQQYSGASGDPDVVGLPGYHIEVKFREHLNIFEAMEQSRGDAKPGEIPVVIHRKSREKWLITMDLEQWLDSIQGGENGERGN